MKTAGVSVVVPVYNNAATLPELCRRVRAALDGRPVEIVLVDDRSTDDSLRVIERLGERVVAHGRNRGQNAAVLSGLAQATEPLTCVLDADLEDLPEGLPVLLSGLDPAGASVVFSSREEPHSMGSRVFRWAIRRLFPSLPPHPCLCFAIDEGARLALVARARSGDYLPAVIGALRLPATQVAIARAARPAGRTAYSGSRRVRYAISMLASACRVRWRRSSYE